MVKLDSSLLSEDVSEEVTKRLSRTILGIAKTLGKTNTAEQEGCMMWSDGGVPAFQRTRFSASHLYTHGLFLSLLAVTGGIQK
jgi:hypothetical protein